MSEIGMVSLVDIICCVTDLTIVKECYEKDGMAARCSCQIQW